MMKGKYYEEESIIRRKVLWERKDYQKKVSSEGKYYYNKSIVRRKSLWDGKYYGRAIILRERILPWENLLDTFMRRKVYSKVFINLDSFSETFNV